MDVSINNQVSSQYTQVIQSVHNRRRIDEQQSLEQDNTQKAPAQQQQQEQPQQVAPSFKAADRENFEQVYQNASSFFKNSSEGQYGISAYKQVQDQAHRDDLQSMLGFSVYA